VNPPRSTADDAGADLSRPWVVVPIRGLEAAKSRLGGPLDAEERLDLVAGLLARTVRAAVGSSMVAGTIVVSPDPDALELAASLGASPVRQSGGELNAALDLARAAAVRAGATAVVVLPADLPEVSTVALEAVLEAATSATETGRPIVALVGDRAAEGTNLLIASPPAAIAFRFGIGSLAAHRAEAAAGGATLVEPASPLDLDLDTPDDLLAADPALTGADPAAAGSLANSAGRRPPGAAVSIVALDGIPEVQPGDDLAALLGDALERTPGALPIETGDVLVVTQKVVSKAEGAIVDLTTVEPRPEAVEHARRWDRDPRQIEVVLREAVRVVRNVNGVLIVETSHGFICANAGVDASNVGSGSGDVVTLLPRDPDASARAIRDALNRRFEADLAVVVSDSFGRPWRFGIVDVAIGVAGVTPVEDLRGRPDRDGRVMRTTVRAVADELASAAELALGKTAARPAALVRGAEPPRGEATIRDGLIPPEHDLFR
jgi:coenzyme F420-0:L-glutamate ligase/coenzyme F420-1:gamma-L-glutamate ligase